MNKHVRTGVVILGVILLGSVMVAAIKRGTPSSSGNGGTGGNSSEQGRAAGGEAAPGEAGSRMTNPAEDSTIGPTKARERPIETALQKKQRQKQRLVETLEKYREAGFGERYPDVVKLKGELDAIEAELAASGGEAKPAN